MAGKTIRVDQEVYDICLHAQGLVNRLMGRHVSMSEAVAYLLDRIEEQDGDDLDDLD